MSKITDKYLTEKKDTTYWPTGRTVLRGKKREEYIVKQNPKDKLWYCLGSVGKYYMPISQGYTDKKKAVAYMEKMPAVHKDMKKLVGGV